jgi:ribosomal RNA assembly protein
MSVIVLSIPEERKSVLIGKAGAVKKTIEQKTRTKISVGDSISIRGDGIGLLAAKSAVQAIGRGFSPDKAFLLFDEENQLDIISLSGSGSGTVKRLMARVIGRNGIIKKEIERSTGCSISVYGKTVSIIGSWDKIHTASRCVELLLSGKRHSTMYEYLRRGERGL